MTSGHHPNGRLRALMAESGWTGEALARAVNTAGGKTGLRLRYRRDAVSRWLAGMRPRPPVPDLVAEVLSRRAGRHVTAQEAGLVAAETGARSPHWWQVVPVGALFDAGVGAYSVAALAVPPWTAHPVEPPAADPRTGPRVGAGEVAAARLMARLFADADTAFGGGHSRHTLASYLSATVAPWLRADATPAVRQALLSTAAGLATLCGAMAVDDRANACAQRHYLAALRLSAEAGNAPAHAVALRGLAEQARLLGHAHHADRLAEAAVRTAGDNAHPRLAASLHGELAASAAAADRGQRAARHLTAAHRALERDTGPDAPPPDLLLPGTRGHHWAVLARHRAEVAARAADRPAAINALRASLRHRPTPERRARALTLARLGELHLAEGQVEDACRAWGRFLDDHPALTSARADAAFDALRAHLRAHLSVPAARALWTRTTTCAAAGAGA